MTLPRKWTDFGHGPSFRENERHVDVVRKQGCEQLREKWPTREFGLGWPPRDAKSPARRAGRAQQLPSM
jgi:hypothetical protein